MGDASITKLLDWPGKTASDGSLYPAVCHMLDVAAVAGSYALYLGIWSFVLFNQVIRAQPAILIIAIGLAAAQAIWHVRLIAKRQRDDCFKAFRLNHWLGLTVFVGIAAAYSVI